ncbi:STYK1 kinase, partial [Amia calva]|nr:STYK1 kinase [Amia calva]
DSPTHLEAKDFLDRVDFHAKVCKHDNLVRMLFCQTQCFPMYLVLKASSPGNLLHFLWKLRKADAASTVQADQFSEKSVYSIAQQVAAGLDYLLSEHQLIHGDVAARNILISDRLAVQVSGLGLAFEAYQTGAVPRYRAAEVPLKWLAPERVLKRPMTARSDVWSFGILLYELITLGSAPYPELEPPDVFKKIQRFYRMKRPDNCGELLYDLMKQCWMWHPEDRPPFPGVIKHLDSHKHSADTKTLTAEASMDILRYSKLAGVLP